MWPERTPPPREELLRRAPELDGLLSLLTDPVDAALIDAAPSLRAISNYAVGVDNVDVEAASARGILMMLSVVRSPSWYTADGSDGIRRSSGWVAAAGASDGWVRRAGSRPG